MRLRDRLVLTLTLAAVVLSVPAVHALHRLGGIQDIVYELRERHAEAEMAATRLRTHLDDLEASLRGYLATREDAARDRSRGALRMATLELDRLEAAGYGDVIGSLEEGVAATDAREQRLDEMVADGRLDEATEYFFGELRPGLSEVRDSLGGVIEEVRRRSARTVLRAAEMGQAASGTLRLALLGCLGIAAVIGVLLTRSLVGPLERLRAAMARVARGDFRVRDALADERRDELGELHRSFRSMTQHLEELERARGELVDIVTHDLKNPIHVAAGYTELLQDGAYGDLSTHQLEAARTVGKQLEILLDQVNQLLDLSRYESGRNRLNLEPVALADLARDLREAFGGPARRAEVEFEVEVDPGTPETIRADRERLGHDLLGNLLSNAFDFTPPGGSVRVRFGGRNRWVHITVEDTGRGIPPEDLPRVFEKYYQAANRSGGTGSGLGLAIARQLTEMHGGTIQVDSELEEGTVFRISLPVEGPPAEPPGVEPGEAGLAVIRPGAAAGAPV